MRCLVQRSFGRQESQMRRKAALVLATVFVLVSGGRRRARARRAGRSLPPQLRRLGADRLSRGADRPDRGRPGLRRRHRGAVAQARRQLRRSRVGQREDLRRLSRAGDRDGVLRPAGGRRAQRPGRPLHARVRQLPDAPRSGQPPHQRQAAALRHGAHAAAARVEHERAAGALGQQRHRGGRHLLRRQHAARLRALRDRRPQGRRRRGQLRLHPVTLARALLPGQQLGAFGGRAAVRHPGAGRRADRVAGRAPA